MADRLDELQEAVARGELDPWVAALARAWLGTEAGSRGEPPTAESLGALLLVPKVLAELEEEVPGGPWSVLAAQARSVRSHGHLGDALSALSDVL
jgi:hypothetical protein